MLNFLENHDEQRFASPFYAGDASRVLPSLVVSTMMSTGPMMIYFGQELGEPATDAEGYSGYDGRTTIFDYWSVATVRRWLNRGRCNGPLTEAQKKLRHQYRTVLRLANSEKAISEGGFFDLMYVNYGNPHFNPHRQYAFLRHCENDVLLVVVNFDNENADVCVTIPSHAFETIGIEPGRVRASELIGGGKSTFDLVADAAVSLSIPAHGAVVWKFSKKATKQKKNKE